MCLKAGWSVLASCADRACTVREPCLHGLKTVLAWSGRQTDSLKGGEERPACGLHFPYTNMGRANQRLNMRVTTT